MTRIKLNYFHPRSSNGIFILERSQSIEAYTTRTTSIPLQRTLVNVNLAVYPLKSSTITTAAIVPNLVHTTSTILTWSRCTLVNISFTQCSRIAEAALAHRCRICRQTKSTILTGRNRTKRYITKCSFKTWSTRARKVVSRCGIY